MYLFHPYNEIHNKVPSFLMNNIYNKLIYNSINIKK